VVLATPVLAIRHLFSELGPLLAPGTIVTDAASTKADVERWAARFLPPQVRFVGGHPMAGKETAGIDHADGTLFRGRTWCIVPPPRADTAAVETVTRLAVDARATTVRMDAAAHDRAVAATSHLPFMASVALCRAVVTRPEFAQMAPVAGTGLRDTTRLASGDAVMHRDICLTNRDNLARELEAFAAHVADLATLVRRLPESDSAAGDPALADLEHLFVRLKATRDGWLHGRLTDRPIVQPPVTFEAGG
jgi:prephenate dehydrogenase